MNGELVHHSSLDRDRTARIKQIDENIEYLVRTVMEIKGHQILFLRKGIPKMQKKRIQLYEKRNLN